MRIERKKNTYRNIKYSFLQKMLQMFLPFIVRTVMIYYMGIKYVGLNSLFAAILQVLNLTELGVGNAIIFSMFKPIAEDDHGKIRALMKLYRKYYRIIGVVVLSAGLLVLPFLKYLVKMDTVPSDINVYYLYLIYLSSSVLTYWLFAYRNSLFNAHQRIDVLSKVSSIVIILQYIAQIVIIIFFKNYYVYALMISLAAIANNIIVAILSKKKYPSYYPEGELEKKEVKKINIRVRDLFFNKIGLVVLDSVDTVVISAVLGLGILAVYQNYYFILTSISGLLLIFFTSVNAGIGNSLILDSEEKNYFDFEKLTFIFMWILAICSTMLICLYQPFMKLWLGKSYMLPIPLMISFCIYFFVKEVEQLLSTYKNAAGKFHEDRYRTIITAIINLTLNLLSVYYLKLYGILLSTVISIGFVGIPWLTKILFKNIFNKKYFLMYLKKMTTYILLTVFVVAAGFLICMQIKCDVKLEIVIKALISFAIPNIVLFVVYRKTDIYKKSVVIFKNTVLKRFKRASDE